jgi:hypothetical protein
VTSEVLPIRQVAAVLHKHVKTVRGLIADGSLRGINTSRGKRPTWCVAIEDLEDFQRSRTTGEQERRRRRVAPVTSKWY